MEYKEVVKLIEESEKRVDEVLKIAETRTCANAERKDGTDFKLRGRNACVDFGRSGSVYDYLFLRNRRKVDGFLNPK